MTPLCPVCGCPLVAGAHSYVCENGHAFDVARQGYVNLLTVAQKHSLHPGDTRDMVAARRDFLNAGHYVPIADTLCQLISDHCAPRDVLDAGCGEGYYLSSVKTRFPDAVCWGVDISKDAVRYAAVRDKRIGWLTATAAALPFAADSFDLLLSMFALTVADEYTRVLKPGGIFVQVLAGEAHLTALKQIIYPQLLHKQKDQQLHDPRLTLLEHRMLEFDISLSDAASVRALLTMTPHYWRISRDGAQRLAQTASLRDRAQVIFNIYRAESFTNTPETATIIP